MSCVFVAPANMLASCSFKTNLITILWNPCCTLARMTSFHRIWKMIHSSRNKWALLCLVMCLFWKNFLFFYFLTCMDVSAVSLSGGHQPHSHHGLCKNTMWGVSALVAVILWACHTKEAKNRDMETVMTMISLCWIWYKQLQVIRRNISGSVCPQLNCRRRKLGHYTVRSPYCAEVRLSLFSTALLALHSHCPRQIMLWHGTDCLVWAHP